MNDETLLMNLQTGTHVDAPGTLMCGTKLLSMTRECEVEDASDGLLQGQDRVSI